MEISEISDWLNEKSKQRSSMDDALKTHRETNQLGYRSELGIDF